ncbi:hypothetical protein C0Q60_24700 [Streptomyces albidoflavus]|nr:hypothetical protein C0Q60_24700 [Streptomyces albidoflavus]RZD94638.1 hypothetical protein C0Q62_24580 [Streptomyces albidoflavus]
MCSEATGPPPFVVLGMASMYVRVSPLPSPLHRLSPRPTPRARTAARRYAAVSRRFYERHGLTATERTDGTRDEEREPDVRHVWRP